ncbi:MAG: hypothetical protein NTW19_18210 [Planctomycetota bacterium]|nr:hypothetical protein [Planctomycetota bacterium]
MRYPFGEARDLYRKHIHPRVMYGPSDLARIRRSIRSGRGKTIMDALRKTMQPHVKAINDGVDVVRLLNDQTRWHVAALDLFPRIHDLAMVAVLDDDDDALAAGKAVLRALPKAVDESNGDVLIHGRIAPALFAFDLLHDHMTAEERAPIVEWTLKKQVLDIVTARRPVFFKQAGMNLAFGKVISAIIAVLAMRDEPNAPPLDDTLKELCLFLEASLNTAVCPDGYPEEDTGYGTDFTQLLFRAVEALRRSGDFDAMARAPHLAKFPRAITHFIEPWGVSLTTTGDAGDHFHARQEILPRLGQIAKDPVAIWLSGMMRMEENAVEIGPAKEGFPAFETPVSAMSLVYLDDMVNPVSPGKAKVPTAFRDARRGIVSFRSGWKPDDTLMIFDGSQRCAAAQGHFHASCGHFTLSALGEYFGIDTGRYNIEQDQHNLVLIDGKSGHSTDGQWVQSWHHGRLTDYRPGKFCDLASVDSSHQHSGHWAYRSAVLVKGPRVTPYAWIIDDLNKANDFAEYWFTINTCPENKIALRKDSATITGCLHGNHLDVHPVLPNPKSYPKPHTAAFAQDVQTTSSYKYVGDSHAAAARVGNPPRRMVHHSVYVRPRLIMKVAGYNGRFMTFLLPRAKGGKPATVETLPSLDGALAARITFDGVEDTLIWAYEHRILEAGDVWGRGDWCVIRRAKGSGKRPGKVLAFEIGNGLSLKAGKKQLL